MNTANSLRILVTRGAALSRPSARMLSEEIKKREIYPAFIKVQEKYHVFQRKDGVPTFLKTGFKDIVLYRFTCFLTTVNVCWMLYFFFEQINK